MSEDAVIKEPDKTAAGKAAKAKPVKPLAPIDPPGTVLKPGVHGPQKATRRATGSDRLRKAMQLSGDVPIETVCDEAAREIEALRANRPRK